MIATFLSMLMLVVLFAMIRGAVYIFQEKINKKLPAPENEETRAQINKRYVQIKKKLALGSTLLIVVGLPIGYMGEQNEIDGLMMMGAFLAFCGMIGFFARNFLVAPTEE